MAKALPLYAVNPQESLRSNAPLMLHTRLEELYQFAPYISDPTKVEELHNMRIAAKRLRYTLEIFAPCFSGKDFTKLYEQAKSIQEQIGEIHDRDVRGPLLQAFLEARAGDRPEIRPGLERLVRSQQTERAKLYRQFISYWNKLQKQGFKRDFLQMLVQTEDTPGKDSVPEVAASTESLPTP
ncbi:MAG: CHAD domain-containing protein [Janthinobacterium lividum]